MRGWVHLPDYLKSHKPEDTYDPAKSLGAYSFGKEHLGKTWFELLELDPDPQRRETFDTAMNMFEDRTPIEGIFPFASLKEQVEQDHPCGYWRRQGSVVLRHTAGDWRGIRGQIHIARPAWADQRSEPGVAFRDRDYGVRCIHPATYQEYVCSPRTFHPIVSEPGLRLTFC
jgi:hypothetical protein